ncbi:MAG: redoxin domain-containing protein [Flavobacteriaceae bacterium]|nr:redoxin domain-containing protein [Flavobacteriaceae bacterium]MCY4266639.1 redoxin domain-containing protein [Flavobacteriaceae bacterium]MCY4299794.1 redoxin domain-containing protein [Flavobacteriaceae bacterium]
MSACVHQSSKNTSVFFGGEVINPLSDYVILYQGEFPIDTLVLNDQNMFASRYDTIHSGIYQLDLLVDAQDILFEPGDSLWIRVNTQGVRESVYFSGLGAAKNNFIADMILKIDQEANQSDYSMTGMEFTQHIDSLLDIKKEDWMEMNSLNQLSPFAQKVTQAAYIYSYSNRRERYALLRGTKFSEVDSLFYDYRKFLLYGDTDLTYFYPYISYLLDYISELALSEDIMFSQTLFSTEFSMKRFDVLESHIFDENLKNYLARIIAFEELMRNPESESHQMFLNKYKQVNSSEYYLYEVLELVEDLDLMSHGQQLPEILLQDVNDKTISSKELLTGKPIVIYFWTQTSVSFFSTQLERVQELKEKFPKYRFIGISIEPFNHLMHQMFENIDVPIEDQFAFVDFKNASRDWVIRIWNKSILVDVNGKIIEGFGNFVSSDFENILSKDQ